MVKVFICEQGGNGTNLKSVINWLKEKKYYRKDIMATEVRYYVEKNGLEIFLAKTKVREPRHPSAPKFAPAEVIAVIRILNYHRGRDEGRDLFNFIDVLTLIREEVIFALPN